MTKNTLIGKYINASATLIIAVAIFHLPEKFGLAFNIITCIFLIRDVYVQNKFY